LSRRGGDGHFPVLHVDPLHDAVDDRALDLAVVPDVMLLEVERPRDGGTPGPMAWPPGGLVDEQIRSFYVRFTS
jgi:hypothetical protein